jgi:two-component system, OmpR family, phosphate regulon response regulator PhoB
MAALDHLVGRHLLVVEDEPQLRRLVSASLEPLGARVTAVATLTEANDALRTGSFDLVITDLGLPDGAGPSTVERLRTAELPVIVTTALRGEEARLACFELGVDDHLEKPYSPAELAARVNAVLRRSASGPEPRRYDGLVVDPVARTVEVDGAAVSLTRREFELLALLTSSPGRTFSRAEILEAVWASQPDWQTPATVTEHVLRIRRKLGSDDGRSWSIESVRGVGYRFVESPR